MIAIILLAAGGSRRMPQGTIKQLLPWNETNILDHAIQQARAVPDTRLLVMLGAHSQALLPDVKNAGVEYGICEDWKLGMGHSLARGMRQIMHHKPVGVMVSLADMPGISTAIYQEYIKLYQTQNKPIIAGRFNHHITPPVLFDSMFFPELLRMKGDQGAGRVVNANRNRTYFIELGEAGADVDTWEDYQKLRKKTAP